MANMATRKSDFKRVSKAIVTFRDFDRKYGKEFLRFLAGGIAMAPNKPITIPSGDVIVGRVARSNNKVGANKGKKPLPLTDDIRRFVDAYILHTDIPNDKVAEIASTVFKRLISTHQVSMYELSLANPSRMEHMRANRRINKGKTLESAVSAPEATKREEVPATTGV